MYALSGLFSALSDAAYFGEAVRYDLHDLGRRLGKFLDGKQWLTREIDFHLTLLRTEQCWQLWLSLRREDLSPDDKLVFVTMLIAQKHRDLLSRDIANTC